MSFIVTRDENEGFEQDLHRQWAGESVISFFNRLIGYRHAAGIPRDEMERADFDAVCALLNELLAMQRGAVDAPSIPGWSPAAKEGFQELAKLVKRMIHDFDLEGIIRRAEEHWLSKMKPKPELAARMKESLSSGDMLIRFSHQIEFDVVEIESRDWPAPFQIQAHFNVLAVGSESVSIPLFYEAVMFAPLDEVSYFRCASAMHVIWSDLLTTSETYDESVENVEALTVPQVENKDTAAPIKWSIPDSPSRWAKRFNCSVDTLKRMIDDGAIRVRKLTTKSWQVAIDDIPAEASTGPQN